jgi:ribosome-associated protein
MTEAASRLALAAAEAASDKKARDIVLVDVSDRLPLTDVFVIATADNERQVQAVVDAVEERLLRDGVKPVGIEGKSNARWVLLDFREIVVHVQHAAERDVYDLVRLWRDCPITHFGGAPAASAPAPPGPGSLGS